MCKLTAIDSSKKKKLIAIVFNCSLTYTQNYKLVALHIHILYIYVCVCINFDYFQL